ncbi:hypothetical protein ACSBOB_11605 [Mesorhizobium sp. ASY16-5R]|uniref:hypothetical protein n=1 Tax=Mesorhizobium sp. ASY16-5R TaxID=3445772 RepID=UPI003F9F5087
MAKYTPDEACFDAANAASGGKLTREEIEAAFQRIADHKAKLEADGDTTNLGDKLKAFAEREGERTRIAAAMQRRHAALNVLVRDRLDETVGRHLEAGLTPRQALLAVVEGTQRGVRGGRNSVAALNLAYEARYIGALMADIQANRPHLVDALRDPKLDADIMREMSELKNGGKPGITGNEDAKYVADVFARFAELSRTDLNRLGASIGKLDGWAGAQTHDDVRMIAAGKDAWVASVFRKLDLTRTFPDIAEPAEALEALRDIFDTIVTGLPNKPSAKEKGQRVNPANLAKSLGKSRVLHFRDADAALAYRDEFGYGNTVSGMIAHLRNAARAAANMQALGPNPEVMFGAVAEGLKRRAKDDPNLSPEVKARQIAKLTTDGGALRHAIDISTGLVSRPVNVTAAKIGSDIRAVQSMAKLGGAVLSSVTGDNVTAAAASMFRGSGFFNGLVTQIGGIMKGRPKGEQAEIAALLGEGFDGLIGHIVAPAAANDGPVGKMAKLQEIFFRLNGLTWWTDASRSVAGRTIAAEMGMRAKTAYSALPANYRHVLGLHDIDAAKWNAIRRAEFRESNGRSYVTPDRVRDLPDTVIEPLVAKRVAAARKASRIDEAKTPATRAKRQAVFDERRAAILGDGRRELELSVLGFIADEVNFGIIETDARSRRTTTLGLRPGTIAGETIRFISQFKSFPIAFTQRVGGRALYGFGKDASYLESTAHIGSLIAGMTMAGYLTVVMKDLVRGYWPPRDPTDPKTMAAAFIQGGAFGLYGDFLFSQTNRFGGSVLESAAGPTIGAAADLIELGLKSRDATAGKIIGEEAKAPYAEAVNLIAGNTPGASLFYIRPALDFLVLNSLRDAISPGYLRRQDTTRRKDYGQTRFRPATVSEALR